MGLGRKLPGKKFEEWSFEDSGTRLKIPVRLIQERQNIGSRRRTDYATVGMTFAVILPDLGIDIRDKDINKLREIVFKELKGKYKVDWELWMLVRFSVDGYRSTREDVEGRASVGLEWESYKIGTRPDGSKVYKQHDRSDDVHDGLPDEAQRRYQNRDDERYALVIASRENLVALERLRVELENAGKKIRQLFEPQQIEATLKRATIGLLGPPPKKKRVLKRHIPKSGA